MGWGDSASASSAPRSQRPAACAYAPCAEAGLRLRFQPVGLTGRRVEPTPRRGELGSDWWRVPLPVRLANPSMYASEQSDRPMTTREAIEQRFFNHALRDHEPAEMVEERGLTKGNLFEADKDCTQRQGLIW